MTDPYDNYTDWAIYRGDKNQLRDTQIRSQVRPISVGNGHDQRAGRVNGPQVELQRNHRPGTPTTGLIYGEALGTGWLSSEEKIENGHHYLFNEGCRRRLLAMLRSGSAGIQTGVLADIFFENY